MEGTGTAASRKTSAPYGGACVNCVRAKCRCIIMQSGDICERCHRLGKDCTPSTTLRKRNAKGATGSKKSQLENKLDDIVNLLRTQNAVPPGSFSGTPSIPTPDSSNHSLQNTPTAYTNDFNLTERDLAHFREDHLPYFPFIHLPPSITAEQLQLEKPMLCLAMRTVCVKANSRQTALSTLLREKLASKILLSGDRSIDLLLSLVVCLAWSTYITHGKQLLGTMSHLARALISDLRIDKPQVNYYCPPVGPHIDTTESRTNEGGRALLAVYGLSAVLSTTFKYDIMSWSSAIEDASDKLIKDEEAAGDLILLNITRLAKICLNAAEVARRASEDSGLAKHILLTIEPLKISLDSLKSTLTAKDLVHGTIVTFLFNAEINIYGLSLLQHPPMYQHPSDYKRIEYLTSCMQFCKSVIDYFLPADVAHITGSCMLVFAHSIKVLYRLSTLNHDSGWDPTVVREAVDLVSILEQTAAAIERANTKLKEQIGEDSILATAAEALRNNAPHWRILGQEIALDGTAALPEWNGGDNIDLSMMDFSDNFWLSRTFDI